MCGFSQSYAEMLEKTGADDAERMRGMPAQEFQQRLEQRLDGLRGMLLQSGHPAPAAAAICQAAREAAQEARQQAEVNTSSQNA
jgi:hypothetical protein